RLIRSMPLPVLREISTTATSGRASASRPSASPISAASPHTSRSGWPPIRKASASRTAGWSSTIRTPARFGSFLLTIVFPRQHAGSQGAGRHGGFDGQARADDGSAIPQDAQAHASFVGCRRGHTDTVVLDAESQIVIRPETDANFARPRMLDGVVHRLLSD